MFKDENTSTLVHIWPHDSPHEAQKRIREGPVCLSRDSPVRTPKIKLVPGAPRSCENVQNPFFHTNL